MAEIRSDDHVDDEYDSEADEDFNPEAAEAPQANDASSSDDENESSEARNTNRTSSSTAIDHDALDFDNSGDEATISKAHRKKRKLNSSISAEEEGGEGGLVKTRAQRRAEQHEKKSVPILVPTSLDVDAVWAQMSHPSAVTPQTEAGATTTGGTRDSDSIDQQHNRQDQQLSLAQSHDEPLVTIKRKVEYAGQIIEEERQVPASSAEAKLYLEQVQQPQQPQNIQPKVDTTGLKRPKKRKSAFDQPQDVSALGTGKKLTTLEKSKLDWAAQVDKEGLADELNEHSRGKADYLGRMDFLGRMDSKREAGARGGGAG